MMSEQDLATYIETAMKDARVTVTDMTGTQDHFEIQVVASVFEGLSLIERHRHMHQILAKPMEGAVHAVKFKTLTPQEHQKK